MSRFENLNDAEIEKILKEKDSTRTIKATLNNVKVMLK